MPKEKGTEGEKPRRKHRHRRERKDVPDESDGDDGGAQIRTQEIPEGWGTGEQVHESKMIMATPSTPANPAFQPSSSGTTIGRHRRPQSKNPDAVNAKGPDYTKMKRMEFSAAEALAKKETTEDFNYVKDGIVTTSSQPTFASSTNQAGWPMFMALPEQTQQKALTNQSNATQAFNQRFVPGGASSRSQSVLPRSAWAPPTLPPSDAVFNNVKGKSRTFDPTTVGRMVAPIPRPSSTMPGYGTGGLSLPIRPGTVAPGADRGGSYNAPEGMPGYYDGGGVASYDPAALERQRKLEKAQQRARDAALKEAADNMKVAADAYKKAQRAVTRANEEVTNTQNEVTVTKADEDKYAARVAEGSKSSKPKYDSAHTKYKAAKKRLSTAQAKKKEADAESQTAYYNQVSVQKKYDKV